MRNSGYTGLRPLFGDIHNHCAISYGHGPLTDALANARERLDFVSITGHAHWPDMPAPTPRLQPVIDFHLEGFEKLKRNWPAMLKTLREWDRDGEFVIFPAFEVHFSATGDRNILYRDLDRPDEDLAILYPNDLADLNRMLGELSERGISTLAQPHHIGYRKGTRGLDWSTWDPEFAPVVELLSMHGCSEESDNTRPFLHVMGPSDWEGTVQYGLARGHVFGVTGSTDHHSGHPGSYGHGLTGLWAENATREAIWNAFYARRTYAMTGDRMTLKFAVNDHPIGSVIPANGPRWIVADVEAGGAIDYVDIVKNGRLIHRTSECNLLPPPENPDSFRTLLYLELGWGPRHEFTQWDACFGISAGKILGVEPRFRGRQVVSPLEAAGAGDESYHTARVLNREDRHVRFEAFSQGNPTNFTSNTQGLALSVELPPDAVVFAELNGQRIEYPLSVLQAGARSGLIDGLESAAWRLHRAPHEHELHYHLEFEDPEPSRQGDTYYLRVRQKNDHWAWTSAIFCR